MPGGRPSVVKRPQFGERLFQLREEKGLSQKQMANLLSITQQSYAAWERRSVSLKPEQLAQLANILEVSVDTLVGKYHSPSRRGGPVGKVRQVFEVVSRMPHHQQRKIVEVVQALVAQNGH